MAAGLFTSWRAHAGTFLQGLIRSGASSMDMGIDTDMNIGMDVDIWLDYRACTWRLNRFSNYFQLGVYNPTITGVAYKKPVLEIICRAEAQL